MIYTALVRRAHGWPVILGQTGTTEREARTKAWHACRNLRIHGFRIDVHPGPWLPQ